MPDDSGSGSDADPVRPDSLIADVIAARPDAARVLLEEFQLPCWDCEVAFHETIAEGVSYTGLDPEVVVARLNTCIPIKGKRERR